MKKKGGSKQRKPKRGQPSPQKKPSGYSQVLKRVLWSGGVIVFITGVAAFMASGGDIISGMSLLQPVLTVTYDSDPSDPLNVNFLFKNEGSTTLKNVQVIPRMVYEIPDAAFAVAMQGHVDKDSLLFLGDIPPQKSAGTRLPIDLRNTLPWEKIKVCMVTSFQNYFYWIHINQGTDLQSVLIDKSRGIVNWLPRRECPPTLPPPQDWDFSREGIKRLMEPYLTPKRP